MTCACDTLKGADVSCQCDTHSHPAPLTIPAGLTSLPRQIATFEDFRRAMLAAAPGHGALATWRGRDDDHGVMILDLWAYACDILAFYDDVIAHEAYLRTARRDSSVRKLVGLLGYRRRPAVASRVALAVAAEGRLTVDVGALSAAKSAAFGGEAPQRFELPRATTVHPLANKWLLEPPRRLTAGGPIDSQFQSLYLDPPTARLKEGELILVAVVDDHARTYTQLRRVETVEDVTADDGFDYVQVTFTFPVRLDATPVARVRLYRVNERIGLWSIVPSGSGTTSNPAAIENIGSSPTLTLDGVYRQVRRNDTVLVSRDGEFRWFVVTSVVEYQMDVVKPNTITTTGSTPSTVSVPAIKSPATRVTLDATLNQWQRGEAMNSAAPVWAATDSANVLLHYGLSEVGRVVVPFETTVSRTDPLRLRMPVEAPPDGWEPSRFILVDRNGTAVDAPGSVDWTTRALTLTDADEWTAPLVLPVTVHGNVVELERGETVTREILGSGDGAAASQEFVLKKSPLTYLPVTAPDGTPYSSTLEVWVDDIAWKEVRSFFNVPPDASVYIVREDDEGKSHVRFGDGVHGRRLPTGSVVRGRYRYGAGAKSPPVDSVNQIAGAIRGVKSWWNPQAAFGGDDAEATTKVRRYGPRSALVLGRAVSLADIEAVGASVGGARAILATWAWDDVQQRPVARVWYVGLPGVSDLIEKALRAVCDPTVPIDVCPAVSVPATLAIDVTIDDRYDGAVVARAVLDLLLAPEVGLLAPERVGIGRPLVRSRLFADVLGVDGTVAVRGLLLDGNAIVNAAAFPGAGRYFDFEVGSVSVNGVVA